MRQVLQPLTNHAPRQPSQAAAGLSREEARGRLAEFGLNEPVLRRQSGPARHFLLLFASPLTVILLKGSVISTAVGDLTGAVIIALMVLMSVTLNSIQTSPACVPGFASLPAPFIVFPIAATGTYPLFVELVKRRLMKRLRV